MCKIYLSHRRCNSRIARQNVSALSVGADCLIAIEKMQMLPNKVCQFIGIRPGAEGNRKNCSEWTKSAEGLAEAV